jgi:hypothetical protein
MWVQDGNRVYVESVEGKFYFTMPDYFNIKDVHPDLLRLAEILLFGYWHRDFFDYKFTRKQEGGNIGLAYSGGNDSTAVYHLLPQGKVKALYHAREGLPMGLLKHDNPLYAMKKNCPEGLVIPSNFEGVRAHYGLAGGFQSDIEINNVGTVGLSPIVALVLLADYLELGYLSMGIVLNPLFVPNGKYYPFHLSPDWLMWQTVFRNACLPLLLPLIPCMTPANYIILKKMGAFAQSCLRGTEGIGCDNCYKCYKHALLEGRNIPMNAETIGTIKTNFMRRTMLVSAMNYSGLDVPELREHKNVDTNFFAGYYKPALGLIPLEYRAYIESQLNKYIEPMDSKKMESFKLC